MARKPSTLVLVIVGVGICGVVLVAGVLVWFFTSALERSPADQATAEARFQELRDRFRDVPPLFEMGPNGPFLNRQRPAKRAAGQLRRLEMLGWDSNDEELVRVTIPFWMVPLHRHQPACGTVREQCRSLCRAECFDGIAIRRA